MKHHAFFITLVLSVLFTLMLPGCKKSDETGISPSVFYRSWEFRVQFTPGSTLNLPQHWMFTFDSNGGFSLFNQPQGSFQVEDDTMEFTVTYTDRYRNNREHRFTFSCTYDIAESHHIVGEVSEAGTVVGYFEAEIIQAVVLYDIIGTWDFTVTYDDSGWGRELPAYWQFTFNDIGELWLFDDRKQTYDFDGRNIRFPCHYYTDESTGSARHLLFLGYMVSENRISGILYRGVGHNNIAGSFQANRTGNFLLN